MTTSTLLSPPLSFSLRSAETLSLAEDAARAAGAPRQESAQATAVMAAMSARVYVSLLIFMVAFSPCHFAQTVPLFAGTISELTVLSPIIMPLARSVVSQRFAKRAVPSMFVSPAACGGCAARLPVVSAHDAATSARIFVERFLLSLGVIIQSSFCRSGGRRTQFSH